MTENIVIVPHIIAREAPNPTAEAVTDLLYGERQSVLEETADWVRVRNRDDAYEGWIPRAALAPLPPEPMEPVRRVRTRLATAYKAPAGRVALQDIGFTSPIPVAEARGGWIRDGHGRWFRDQDLTAEPMPEGFADLALLFLGVPYVWGGRHGGGIDCSGLVQVTALAKGHHCLRDTGDQVESFGHLLEGTARDHLQRDDILYMPGHVAILTGPLTAVHADGLAGYVHEQDIETILAERGFRFDEATIRRPV